MNMKQVGALALGAAATVSVAGCTDYYDGYGYGYSRPYYGSTYRYGGYGYTTPYYYGWYDNYYYPGVGIYLYDRGGTRYRWNDGQRQYWQTRRGTYNGRENWSGYRNPGSSGARQGRQWDGTRHREGRHH